MSHRMSIEELKKLKRGEHVCVQGHLREITSKGPKWIHLAGEYQPIDMTTGLLKANKFGCGNQQPIYRSQTLYNLAQEDAAKARKLIQVLRQVGQRPMTSTQVDALTLSLKNLGLWPKN